MSKRILDLRPIIEDTLEIIFAEDDSLKLKKPTEALVLRLSQQIDAFEKASPEGETEARRGETVERQLGTVNQLLADVLSNNIEGRQVSVETVEKTMPLSAKLAIIKCYAEFATEIGADPNSNALPSPDGQADGLTP